jgi:phage baseplate assembly protein W
MATYKGFNTQSANRKFRLADFELIKRDLINHFNIRRGEKLMRPTFGCGIWAHLFEPLMEDTRQKIVDEIKQVIDYEPRVNADKVTVTSYDQGVQVEIILSLVNSNQTSKLIMQFDQNKNAVMSL